MSILRYFLNLYRERRQIALLSWIYTVTAVIVLLIAGIFALINQSVGVAILIVPLVALSAMAANIVVWALLRMILESALDKFGDYVDERASAASARVSARATKTSARSAASSHTTADATAKTSSKTKTTKKR